MLHSSPRYPRRSSPTYYMQAQLAVESQHKDQVVKLFKGHQVDDISSDKSERKTGTDFLLRILNSDGTYCEPIRCENKFEQKCTGRAAYELVSVDRPQLVPGWMFTSQAAWLMSWFPSGEVIALPMDQVRELILNNYTRHKSTTAGNPRYLTWNCLEDVDYVVRNVRDARVLDLADELGMKFDHSWMLNGSSLQKRCTVAELVELMRSMPRQSQPVAVSQAELQQICRNLAPLNFFKKAHADRLSALPWL